MVRSLTNTTDVHKKDGQVSLSRPLDGLGLRTGDGCRAALGKAETLQCVGRMLRRPLKTPSKCRALTDKKKQANGVG